MVTRSIHLFATVGSYPVANAEANQVDDYKPNDLEHGFCFSVFRNWVKT